MATKKPDPAGGDKKPAARRAKTESPDQPSKAEPIGDATTAEAPATPAVAAEPSSKPEAAEPTGAATPPVAPPVQNHAFIAMGLAIVAVILAMTAPLWGPRVYGDPMSARIASTDEMLKQVTNAVREIEAAIPGLRTASGDRATRLQAIELRLEEIKLPSFLLAIGELRRALRGSEPFETELDVAITVTGGGSELGEKFENIADLAAYGVPTTRQLNRRFGEIAQRVFLVSQLPDNPTVTSRALARLNAVAIQVRVRFFGERPGNDVTAIISRVQARIDEGNLPRATEELGALPKSAQAVAANWVEDANKRIRVNEMQGYLKTLMMKRAVAGNKS